MTMRVVQFYFGVDIKADVDAAIGKLGAVKAGSLTARTEVVAKDLADKYPNADRLHVADMMSARTATC
jgi:hypothetical protein